MLSLMIPVPSTNRDLAEPARHKGSFSKMRLEHLAARTEHVAFMEAVEGHMFSLCLISRNLFVMGQSVMTLAFPVTFWDMPAPSVAVCF